MSKFDREPSHSDLVTQLGSDGEREAAFAQLLSIGTPARTAVREGLGHSNWQVRRWCAMWQSSITSQALLILAISSGGAISSWSP